MTTKPPTIPLPGPATKAPKTLQTSVSNSTINPVVITTQFPSAKTRAASEPREKNTKPSISPPIPPKRSTPTPPLEPVVNGHKKKTTPPGTVTQPPRAPSPDKTKVTVNKPSSTSIFVPPPTLPNASNVRIDANIEIGRLEMEDVAEKEPTKIYESYVNDLIEEIIQSDFEKPSIPEVILAVITDLTNDDDHHERQLPLPPVVPAPANLNQIYNFNQDKPCSTSPMPYPNTNGTNGDIEHYYTRVHQTVTNNNGVNNHDSVRSTNSSNQSSALATVAEPTSNYVQVGLRVFLRRELNGIEFFFRLEQHVVVRFELPDDLSDPMVKKKKLLQQKLSNPTTITNQDYPNGKLSFPISIKHQFKFLRIQSRKSVGVLMNRLNHYRRKKRTPPLHS